MGERPEEVKTQRFDPRRVQREHVENVHGREGLSHIHEELLGRARSKDDPERRKVITDLLRGLGVRPTVYMLWDAEERVLYIMKNLYCAKTKR